MPERRGHPKNPRKAGFTPELKKEPPVENQRFYKENHGRYAYRRITMALGKAGITINHKTTLKLMRQR